jgi:hypothetical protein
MLIVNPHLKTHDPNKEQFFFQLKLPGLVCETSLNSLVIKNSLSNILTRTAGKSEENHLLWLSFVRVFKIQPQNGINRIVFPHRNKINSFRYEFTSTIRELCFSVIRFCINYRKTFWVFGNNFLGMQLLDIFAEKKRK